MTRQHFELIAETIRHLGHPGGPSDQIHHVDTVPWERQLSIAIHFANELELTNPNFDRQRFIEASTKDLV